MSFLPIVHVPTVVVGPDHEPLTLEQAKAHLRVEHELEDDVITRHIRTAREMAQERTARTLLPTTYRLKFDAWPPDGSRRSAGPLRIDDDVREVLSVKYRDDAGELVELDAEAYQLIAGPPSYVAPAYGLRWPRVRCGLGAIEVEYVAGYASDGEIPSGVLSWMLLQVGNLYENRESTVPGVSIQELPQVDRLLRPALWSYY